MGLAERTRIFSEARQAMFFRAHLTAAATILDANSQGMRYKEQNSADVGEHCELFLKTFLAETFTGMANVHRGGKVVDVAGNKSKQMDMVLTGRNSLQLMTNKGLYPIETVFGIVSVTSTLDHHKLADCIDECRSLPIADPRFHLAPGSQRLIECWRKLCPYKVVFGYRGDLTEKSIGVLMRHVKNGVPPDTLPDLIMVNKVGWIQKVDETRDSSVSGGQLYQIKKFQKEADYFLPLNQLLSDLYHACLWHQSLIPLLQDYFEADAVSWQSEQTALSGAPLSGPPP
jgi:hypothetical protein